MEYQVGDFDVRFDWDSRATTISCGACGLKWNADRIPSECPYCGVRTPRDEIRAGGAKRDEQIKEVPLFHATARVIERIRAVFPKKDPHMEQKLFQLHREIFQILLYSGFQG